MNTTEIAAIIASVLLATLIIFQLLLAAGLPLAAYVWGGQYEGVLPTNLRWASLVAIPILALAAWSVLAGTGLVLLGAESRLLGIAVWVFDAVRAGANGYILKDTPPEQLFRAVREAADGKTLVDPAVAGKLFKTVADQPEPQQEHLVEPLTEWEIEIVRLMAGGLTNAEIGAELYLSEGTIRNYISTILGKMGVKDRTQAVVMAIRYGLIDIRPAE
jgi:DNA-binding CsgD family transcriptional regulator